MPLTEKQKKKIIIKMDTLNQKNLKKTLEMIDKANTEQLRKKINNMNFVKVKEVVHKLVESDNDEDSESEYSD